MPCRRETPSTCKTLAFWINTCRLTFGPAQQRIGKMPPNNRFSGFMLCCEPWYISRPTTVGGLLAGSARPKPAELNCILPLSCHWFQLLREVLYNPYWGSVAHQLEPWRKTQKISHNTSSSLTRCLPHDPEKKWRLWFIGAQFRNDCMESLSLLDFQ